MHVVGHVPISESRLEAIRTATEADQVMTALKQTILQGWPEERSHVPPLVHPYYARIEALAVYEGIVYGRNRFPGRTRCCTSQPEEHPKRENPFITSRNRWMPTQNKGMPILAEHSRIHHILHISVRCVPPVRDSEPTGNSDESRYSRSTLGKDWHISIIHQRQGLCGDCRLLQ